MDHWGSAAIVVMDTSDTKYTGRCVWEECFGIDGTTGKASTILRKLRRQVRILCTCLNQDNSEVNLDKVKLIAELVTEVIEQGKTKEEMIDWARKLQHNVEACYNQSKAKLNELLITHTRKEGYGDIYARLSTEIPNSGIQLDKDDLEIILDAHDLTSSVDALILVTGDKEHIVDAARIICDITGICDVRYLAYYKP